MSSFLSGADVSCGPSSVLKNVIGRLDRDISLQQDRLISTPNVASSSRNAFRPPPTSASQRSAVPHPAPTPFDVSQLAQHLPPQGPQHPYQSAHPDRQWAGSYRPAVARPSIPASATPRQSFGPSEQDVGWAQQFNGAPRSSSTSGAAQQSSASGFQAQYRHARPPWARAQPRMQFFPPQGLAPSGPLPHPSLALSSAPPAASSYTTSDPAQPQASASSARLDDFRAAFADPEFQSALAELQQGQDELAARQTANGEAFSQAGNATEGAEQGKESLVDSNGVEWSGDFSHTSTNQINDAALTARQADEATSLPENYRQDDTPADLARILNIPPPIPSLMPVRPGGESVFNQATQDELFGDQNAVLMADNTRIRSRSVHFDEAAAFTDPLQFQSGMPAATMQDGQMAPMGNGVPTSLEEALHHAISIPGRYSSWEDPALMEDRDLDLESFDQEAFMQFNGEQRVQQDTRIGVGDLEGWAGMQRDLEGMQADTPKRAGWSGTYQGMARDDRYLFQSRNPYTQAAEEAHVGNLAPKVTEVGRESPTLKGVLELEAAVQGDPTDHEAWYALGLKQQENEREVAAINALAKVVQLDPDYRPAYLALAVSYTNEGSVEAANAMLAKWIQLDNPTSEHPYATLSGQGEEMTDKARQEQLVGRLVDIARTKYANGNGELDADVQVALGVLFNASEEFDKARDCFEAALEARPDDWLLYNRLGATLANGGNSQEALGYYYKALELHPNFVRALFNLGISHMNLAQYPTAAQRVLDALRLQQADATEGYAAGTAGKAAKGVTSDALWNSLRNACLHMGRNDLVALATRRDLSAFPADISAGRSGDADELR